MTSTSTSTVIAIDGVIVPPERATISVLDRGLLYGDGAFEVLRTWNRRAVELDRHLDRLAETCAALQLRLDRGLVERAVADSVLQLAGAEDVRIRVVVTRGPGPLSAPLDALSGGHTIVIAEPMTPVVRGELSAVTIDMPIARRAGRGHKTLAYLDHVVARELARQAGADEAIRLDGDGSVIEGATSNLFAVIAGEVLTPPVDAGVLPGIVRRRVLELHPVSVRSIARAELASADELFITSSIRGVVAVSSLDGTRLTPGPITERIARGYVACMMALATI